MTKIARPPGPRDRLFGLPQLRRMRRDYLGYWREMQGRYGDVVYLRTLNFDQYAFLHPELIREVLVEKADSFIRYERHMEVLAELQGQSLLVTEGEVWKRQRRTLLPAFSPKRFDGYARQMTDVVHDRLASLQATEGPVDFEHAMNMLTIDAILRTMFGSRGTHDTADIERAVRVLSNIAYEEMFLPFALPDWLPLARNAEKRRCLRLLDDLIWSHIHARRGAAEAGNDLLGMLLSAADSEGDGGALSDREVRDQMMVTFMAGHETTAAGLTWAGWALAAHPDIAATAAAEVDRVLGGRAPTFADLPQLPFVGAVVKEVLRLYPPAPGVFMRRAARDVRIGQWLVPKGSLVTILSVITHGDPRWFAEPRRFDPWRFLGDAARTIERGAYFPFGNGPRICIGNSFATMEMTLALAMLLQRFVLRPAPGQGEPDVHLQVTLRPEGGVRLVLEKRSDWHAAEDPAPAPLRVVGCPFH